MVGLRLDLMDTVLARRFLALEFEVSLCVSLRLDMMDKVDAKVCVLSLR